jgi:alanyl-tRNA synthetase
MFDRITIPQHIPATHKIFLDDPYIKTIDATVLYSVENFVVLDRSIFYAESGGQDFDIGYIDDCEVIDVQDQGGDALLHETKYHVPTIKINTIIVHKTEQVGAFKAGQRVSLKIDWERRYKLMRNHSASHFLYHACEVVVKKYNSEPIFTSGCHISESGVRFDFMNVIDPDWTPEIEQITNDLIAQGKDIVIEKEQTTKDVFYWRYGNDIMIPCGGTHVRSAKEIGPVVVGRKGRGKGRVRIRFSGVSGE